MDIVGIMHATAGKPWLMIVMSIIGIIGGSTVMWKYWMYRSKLKHMEAMVEAKAEAEIDIIRAKTEAKIKLAALDDDDDEKPKRRKSKPRKPKED